MLRFSYFRSPDGERWVLSGQLCRPWIEGLRSLWRCFRYRSPRERVIVVIKDVTAVDPMGAQLLADMQRAGVGFAEDGMQANPAAKNGDGRTQQSGDSHPAEDRQTP